MRPLPQNLKVNQMDKQTLKKRCKEAETASKHIEAILKRLDKVPPFKGKAAFMDRIISARMEAHNLAWDLKRDSEQL